MDDEPCDELLLQVQAGDEDAARRFFHLLYPTVLRIVRNHLPPCQSEDDLCQMVFAKIFTKLDQYSGNVPISHWVSRVAVNTCLNDLKKHRRNREITEADFVAYEGDFFSKVVDSSINEQMAANHARELLATLLAHLAPMDRLMISLLHIEGRSVDEVREVTGFSKATVKIRAFRARRKLQQIARQWSDHP